MILRRTIRIAILAILLPCALHAQKRATGPSAATGDSTRVVPRVRKVHEAVVFKSEPRSYQVVRVPVPDELRGADSLSVEIQPESPFLVIGTRRARLSGANASADVLVTVGIPAATVAGAHMAAHAIFRSGRNEIDVPLETRVTPIYKIAVTVESEISDIQLGDRVELHANIINVGNATDTIQLRVEPPPGWRATLRDPVIVLGPGTSAPRIIHLHVPGTSGIGSFFVRLHATSRGSNASTLTTLLVGSAPADASAPGPSARFSLGTVAVQGGPSSTVGQMAVAGQLTGGIRVDARLSTQPAMDAASMRGLARVGTFVTTPQLAAWSDTWRLGVGNLVADFGDVVGVNAGGHGASFDFDDHRSTYHVVVARSAPVGDRDDDGAIFGGQLARRVGFASIGASAARFESNSRYRQNLSSYGMDFGAEIDPFTSANASVAYRDFDSGTGMGYTGRLAHRTSRNKLDFSFVHAPGGSSAFARAENELSASAGRVVTDKYEVAASYVRMTDAASISGDSKSRSASFLQQYRFSDRMSMRSELRASLFDVASDPFTFSNDEKHADLSATIRFGEMIYTNDIAIERLRRGFTGDGVDVAGSGERFTWHGTFSRPLNFGSLMLEGGYERSDRATGHVPEQVNASARIDNAQLPFGPNNISLDAEIGHFRWSGVGPITTYRAGINYLLPHGTEVAASVERNAYFFGANGRAPAIFAFRVEKSVGLPRMGGGKLGGVVFQDYNGNGRRDEGEPGMPNIVVRRGSGHAVTARNGSYRFWESGSGRVEVDAATLPYGWIVNDKTKGNDIALVPTTVVEITLQLGTAELMRRVDLTNVTVFARDELGRKWTARRTSADGAVFEALPVGSYEIEIDFAAAAEPLKINGTAPRVEVTRETKTRLVVPIAGRPLRFRAQQEKQ